MKIGRNGWYKVIQTKNSFKAMYKSLNTEEFLVNRDNPSLREYLNYTNLYDASGIVAFNLGEYRVVPSNRYHLQYLLHKVQMVLFGESSVESLLISSAKFERLQKQKEELTREEMALAALYKIEQNFLKGKVMEECCNIGGKIEFDDFQTLFWVYEMLLQKAEGKIDIPEKYTINSLKYEAFIKEYPDLEVSNLV